MGAPAATDARAAKAAILGVPYDAGIHPFRVGSRQGPTAIREQSRLIRRFDPDVADFDPLARLGAVDCGDVALLPGRPIEAFPRIEEAVWRIVRHGVVPVTMGGDGSMSLPQMRALARKHPGLACLHVDAHTDCYDYGPPEPYTPANQFAHAADEGLLDAKASIHLGLRGPTYCSGVIQMATKRGYEVITQTQWAARGTDAVLRHVRERLAGRKVYLCFDMDIFDPSVAPGVATPTWGGISAREGIDLMRALAGLDIVAVDVNTVSPAQDLNGLTAHLAATIMYEGLVLVCRKLGLDR
ncbi:MAG: arginase family protein [Alphaproteobacteria bacterium]|nr:arginase family protein [Alphaproteobacteria bacterium]